MKYRMSIGVMAAFIFFLNQFSCFSQQQEDEIAIISKLVRPGVAGYAYPKTVSLESEDLSRFENVKAWNDGNNEVSNFAIDRTVDFDTIFSKENLKHIVKGLKQNKEIKLRKIVSKSLLRRKGTRGVSSPVFVEGIDNNQYAIIYSEMYNGMENGAGGLTIFQKKKDEWVEFFWVSLWIS